MSVWLVMTGMSVRGTAVRSLPGSSVAGAHRFGSPPMAQAKQFSSLLNCRYFEFTWVRSSGLKTTTFSHALFFWGEVVLEHLTLLCFQSLTLGFQNFKRNRQCSNVLVVFCEHEGEELRTRTIQFDPICTFREVTSLDS